MCPIVLLHLVLLDKAHLAVRALEVVLAENVFTEVVLVQRVVPLQRGLVDKDVIAGGADRMRQYVLLVEGLYVRTRADETMDNVVAEVVLLHLVLQDKVHLTVRALEAVYADVLLQHLPIDKAHLAAVAHECRRRRGLKHRGSFLESLAMLA